MTHGHELEQYAITGPRHPWNGENGLDIPTQGGKRSVWARQFPIPMHGGLSDKTGTIALVESPGTTVPMSRSLCLHNLQRLNGMPFWPNYPKSPAIITHVCPLQLIATLKMPNAVL